MPIARYQAGELRLLLDFDKPILQVGLSTFLVNSVTSTSVLPGPSTDSLWVYFDSSFNTLDDLKLVYTAVVPMYYLIGLPSERLITAFSIPVIVEQIASEIQNLSNTNLSPVLGDFIDAYGLQEAIAISNPDNALALSPDEYKFLRAFEDAEILYNTYLLAVDLSNQAIINAGKRRTILIFARYFLDSRCRRKIVTLDYENAIETLTKANKTTTISGRDLELYGNSDEIVYSSYNCPSGPCGSC